MSRFNHIRYGDILEDWKVPDWVESVDPSRVRPEVVEYLLHSNPVRYFLVLFIPRITDFFLLTRAKLNALFTKIYPLLPFSIVGASSAFSALPLLYSTRLVSLLARSLVANTSSTIDRSFLNNLKGKPREVFFLRVNRVLFYAHLSFSCRRTPSGFLL